MKVIASRGLPEWYKNTQFIVEGAVNERDQDRNNVKCIGTNRSVREIHVLVIRTPFKALTDL